MLVVMLHPRETGPHSAEWAVILGTTLLPQLISMTITGSSLTRVFHLASFLISQQIGTDPSTFF